MMPPNLTNHGAVFHGSLVFEAAMESGWPRNLQAVENWRCKETHNAAI